MGGQTHAEAGLFKNRIGNVQKVSPLSKQLYSRTKEEKGRVKCLLGPKGSDTVPGSEVDHLSSHLTHPSPFSFLLGLLMRVRSDHAPGKAQARRKSTISGGS